MAEEQKALGRLQWNAVDGTLITIRRQRCPDDEKVLRRAVSCVGSLATCLSPVVAATGGGVGGGGHIHEGLN